MSRTSSAHAGRGLSRLRRTFLIVGCALAAVAVAAMPASAKPRNFGGGRVVVLPGQAVQIVVAVDDTGVGAAFAQSLREAVQMAVERHPRIRNFAIKINSFSAPCDGGSAASLAENAAVASAVVGNSGNVAVLGHVCSAEAPAWLPIYQAAGVVTINGSTTGLTVPALGPTVFNGTAVPGPAFDAWYASVVALPSDVAWRSRFQARFGSPPSDFADLYYDATNVLLKAIDETARIEGHRLTIDRAALATVVRRTNGFRGVTCTVSLDRATGYRVDDPAALARCAHQGGTDD